MAAKCTDVRLVMIAVNKQIKEMEKAGTDSVLNEHASSR